MRPQTPKSLDMTLVVLCGGQGSRMQGADKPLLLTLHNGEQKPMIDHVVRRI